MAKKVKKAKFTEVEKENLEQRFQQVRDQALREWYEQAHGDYPQLREAAEARLQLQVWLRDRRREIIIQKQLRDICKADGDIVGSDVARKKLKHAQCAMAMHVTMAKEGIPTSTAVKARRQWTLKTLTLEKVLDDRDLDKKAEFGVSYNMSNPNPHEGEKSVISIESNMKAMQLEDKEDENKLDQRENLNSPDTTQSNRATREAKHPPLHPNHTSGLVKAYQNDVHSSEKPDEAVQIVHSPPSTKAPNIDAAKSAYQGTLRNVRYIAAMHSLAKEDEISIPGNKGHDLVLSPVPTLQCSKYLDEDNVASVNGDSDDMNCLLNDSGDEDAEDSQIYGLIGSYDEAKDRRSKLFLNTNVPFSIFLCGVQGSGKSHTTSCILENTLVPSKLLGRLQSPLSALVFSYGQFNGDGIGFSISEAAFLASSNPRLPSGAHVKRVNVLVSPSNYVRISKLYLQLPNVTVTPFKLKPHSLDIDTMLTLMNVSEADEIPLYMAQVTQILREMSTAGRSFDYRAFKLHLKKQEFNPTQTNMLRMRLNLLESFLDVDDGCFEPQFRPGEITIMDMSCPFVDANTACILFKIGLQRYLQSKGTGKIIVLDEAHKVFNLNTSERLLLVLTSHSAKSLTETLLQTIRLQRHHGARVVISTQEPTLLTDLIALCSITVIHRFSSPEWFSAIKRHIPVTTEDRDSLLQRIESLTTGTAIVYSPNAVIGCDDDGNLIKGTSRMIKVSIRKRVTSDGGQSMLAV
ncbi:hypothetical protein GQ44DRAFT_754941 [Phaeosphaeriaceae sp. PMI808]|nr:hypothetical protein GQ44DRAFT_754941 [Phaeosphaeriaceae sp. PMI808]